MWSGGASSVPMIDIYDQPTYRSNPSTFQFVKQRRGFTCRLCFMWAHRSVLLCWKSGAYIIRDGNSLLISRGVTGVFSCMWSCVVEKWCSAALVVLKTRAGEVLTHVSSPLHCHQREKSSSCACTLHLAWSLTDPGLGVNNKPDSHQCRDTAGPRHSHQLKWPFRGSHTAGLIISTRWCEQLAKGASGSLQNIKLQKLHCINNKNTLMSQQWRLIKGCSFQRSIFRLQTNWFFKLMIIVNNHVWWYWLDNTNIPL